MKEYVRDKIGRVGNFSQNLHVSSHDSECVRCKDLIFYPERRCVDIFWPSTMHNVATKLCVTDIHRPMPAVWKPTAVKLSTQKILLFVSV